MELITQGRLLLDLLIAIILGGVIGFEREKKDKPAGFRTQMIISGASALIVMMGQFIVDSNYFQISDTAAGVDPTRLIHAVIVGVSFIGAGTVLKLSDDHKVRYLTTAATILISSAVGMCVALHLYLLAVGTTLAVVLINTVVRKISS